MDSYIKPDQTSSANKKRAGGGLTEWLKKPLERLNHETNFEEYACSPPDRIDYLCGVETPTISLVNTWGEEETPARPNTAEQAVPNRKILSESLVKSNSESKLLRAYTGNTLSNTLIKEAYLSPSMPSSQENTPQSSPLIQRKNLGCNEAENLRRIKSSNNMAVNPKKWFYNGFLDPNRVDGCDANKKGYKKFHVSENSEINAVGPTTW